MTTDGRRETKRIPLATALIREAALSTSRLLRDALTVPVAEPASDDDDEYQSGQWFAMNTKIPLSRLRQAASPKRRTKHVKTKKVDGVVFYSVDDARRWWPDAMRRP